MRDRQITERTANASPGDHKREHTARMEWFLILSAFVVGEISGMWLAAMMRPARPGDESARPVHNQVAMVAPSWTTYGKPVLVKPRAAGRGLSSDEREY